MTGEQIPQLTLAALDRMTPEQIVAARKAGKLEALRRGEPGDVDDPGIKPENQLTRADLAEMTPEAIVKARREGRLADLLAGAGSDYTDE